VRSPGRATIDRVRHWLAAAPAYPAGDADHRVIDVFGLRLPARATIAMAVVTLVVLLDYGRTVLPDEVDVLGRSAMAMRVVALERAVLFGIVPLAVVVFAFRDRPSRYGVALGDWRAGLALLLVGCAVMTPFVLWFATLPDVRAYYAPSVDTVPGIVLTNALDLTAAEFLFRGFLTFTLLRAIGPAGVLVATMPFIYTHIGKPELELFSTLAGGLVYGWLAWRTRSMLWGAIGHVYILSLVVIAADRAALT
jgi:membrane protease YdiL (CAAX protease family)